MLARIAHDLHWLGRSLARADHTARLLDGVFAADLQSRPGDAALSLNWGGVLAIMGSEPAEDALGSLTLDESNPASVRSCVGRAREGARVVRDVISAEMWEAVNTFHLELGRPEQAARLRTAPYLTFKMVRERCALFWGVTQRTMLRDEAKAFLQAGRRLESADMVLRMLQVALPAGIDESERRLDGQALALLQAVGGFQAFRRAVPAPPNAGPVVRFLLFERAYPDSVAAAVEAAKTALERADDNPRTSEPVLRLSRLAADLEFRARAVEGGEGADPQEVFALVGKELAALDLDIAERYFAGAMA